MAPCRSVALHERQSYDDEKIAAELGQSRQFSEKHPRKENGERDLGEAHKRRQSLPEATCWPRLLVMTPTAP